MDRASQPGRSCIVPILQCVCSRREDSNWPVHNTGGVWGGLCVQTWRLLQGRSCTSMWQEASKWLVIGPGLSVVSLAGLKNSLIIDWGTPHLKNSTGSRESCNALYADVVCPLITTGRSQSPCTASRMPAVRGCAGGMWKSLPKLRLPVETVGGKLGRSPGPPVTLTLARCVGENWSMSGRHYNDETADYSSSCTVKTCQIVFLSLCVISWAPERSASRITMMTSWRAMISVSLALCEENHLVGVSPQKVPVMLFTLV